MTRILRLIGATASAFLLAINGASGQQAEVSSPATAAPGSTITVTWNGPDAPGDFLAIAEASAPPASFVVYVRTTAGNPAAMTAPAVGEYEVRYILAASLQILARVSLSVGVAQTETGISAPSEVEAGSDLLIEVAKPGDPADYVTIVRAGEPDDAFGPYERLRGARQVTLMAPGAAGAYEIRQIQASAQIVLARASLTVLPVPEDPASESATATEPPEATSPESQPGSAAATPPSPNAHGPSLIALVAVDRTHTFRVAWIGPGADGDRIVVLAAGDGPEAALDDEPALSGSPVSFTAPDAAGEYEIVYVDGATGNVLARRGLEVR